jgi:DNA-binding CsgD family transcriptional regulator
VTAIRRSSDEILARVPDLSDAQLSCLRLVLAHLNSKEIARELGVSPHAVDARLRSAIAKLGVASRTEAALALADYEGIATYQPLTCQASHLDRASIGVQDLAALESAGRVDGIRSDGTYSEQTKNIGHPPLRQARLPGVLERVDTVSPSMDRISRWNQPNELSRGQRLAVILAISLLSSIAVAALALTADLLNRLGPV